MTRLVLSNGFLGTPGGHSSLFRYRKRFNEKNCSSSEIDYRLRCIDSFFLRASTKPIDQCSPLDALEHVDDTKAVIDTLESYNLNTLIEKGGEIRDKRVDSRIFTFSPKVFLPITRACRQKCEYCTFVIEPTSDRRIYMTVEEVLAIARIGAEHGCTEALFTLGDKPELKYTQAMEELQYMGFSSTIEYVQECARLVLHETGLLPHINAGVIEEKEMAALRHVSASQGLMLESISDELLKPGNPHYNCPDKVPQKRLRVIEMAGALKIPFTTGILVGIGDNRWDRIKGLLKIRDLHRKYEHIQEIIIQNFIPKRNTGMSLEAEIDFEEFLFTVAAARILFGPEMNIQVPPNLSDGSEKWLKLMQAGINDWGGISPGITPDYVNPEKPWPELEMLSDVTSQADRLLVPRLPVYPSYLRDYKASQKWLDGSKSIKSVLAKSLALADADGAFIID